MARGQDTYKHRSSTTLTMLRMPRWFNLGVGAAASEPSPRNNVPSSFFTLPKGQSMSQAGEKCARTRIRWVGGSNIQLGGFSDSKRSHSDCR